MAELKYIGVTLGLPRVCRIVLFHDRGYGPVPAIVTKVWSPTCVNLMVFPSSGNGAVPYGVGSVTMSPSAREYWSWLPDEDEGRKAA